VSLLSVNLDTETIGEITMYKSLLEMAQDGIKLILEQGEPAYNTSGSASGCQYVDDKGLKCGVGIMPGFPIDYIGDQGGSSIDYSSENNGSAISHLADNNDKVNDWVNSLVENVTYDDTLHVLGLLQSAHDSHAEDDEWPEFYKLQSGRVLEALS